MWKSSLVSFTIVASAAAVLAGCKPPPPPPGPAFATSGTITVGVVYTPPGPGLATWTYYVTDTAGFDRITFSLSKPCKTPTSGGGPKITPPSGDTANPVLDYIVNTTSAKIVIACDAEAGGTAAVGVLTTSGTTVAGPTLSVLGPK